MLVTKIINQYSLIYKLKVTLKPTVAVTMGNNLLAVFPDFFFY